MIYLALSLLGLKSPSSIILLLILKYTMENQSQKAVAETQEIENQTSISSAMTPKGLRFKIMLQGLSVDENKLESPKKPKITVQYIARMIDKIRLFNKRKRAPKKDERYDVCHSCQGLLETKILLFCIEQECDKKFCFRCLNKKFNKNLQDIYEMCNAKEWSCISCNNLCDCQKCREEDPKTTSEPRKVTIVPNRIRKNQMNILKTGPDFLTNDNKNPKIISDQDLSDKSHTQSISPTGSVIENSSVVIDNSVESSSITKNSRRSKIFARNFLFQKRLDQSETDIVFDDERLMVQTPTPEEDIEKLELDNIQPRNKKISSQGRYDKKECHVCQNLVEKIDAATCSVENCRKNYCCNCIKQLYQDSFELSKDYNLDLWICYSCGGTCECKKCQRRRNAIEKNQNTKRLQEELLNPRLNKKASKLNDKRKMKHYDILSEEEGEEERKKSDSIGETFKVSLDEDEQYHKQRKQVKTDQVKSSDINLKKEYNLWDQAFHANQRSDRTIGKGERIPNKIVKLIRKKICEKKKRLSKPLLLENKESKLIQISQ